MNRKEMILLRKKIDSKKEKSHEITLKVIQNAYFQKAKHIALYKSMIDEVSTDEIISYCFEMGKNVYLPKIVGDSLIFYEIKKDEVFVTNSFLIEEPIGEESKKMQCVDCMIIPGVIFDKMGNRIGYGKGYYDRYLKDIDVYKIGICFQEQLVDSIVPNEWDIRMDEIITD